MCHNMGLVGGGGGLSQWHPAGAGCGLWVLWLVDCGCGCILQLPWIAGHSCICGLSVVVPVGCGLRLRALGVAGVAFPEFFQQVLCCDSL